MKRLTFIVTGAVLALPLAIALPLAFGLPVALGLARSPAGAEPHAPERKAVVELFTSQGCSSCPTADALLGRLAERPDLIALSYSVDYWDYLGWHDTLSTPANSERQRDYARARGDGAVYTPQAVIDGITHVNGSNSKGVEAAIKSAEAKLADAKVTLSMHAEGDNLVINIGAASDKSTLRQATVWIVAVKDIQKVTITRGENRGRQVSYHHAVRELSPVGMWKGDAMTLRLPLKDLRAMSADCMMALLQVENAGPILAAAEYEPL